MIRLLTTNKFLWIPLKFFISLKQVLNFFVEMSSTHTLVASCLLRRFSCTAVTWTTGLLSNSCEGNKRSIYIKPLTLLLRRSTTYNLRGKDILTLPKDNSTKQGLRSWRYLAPKIWNALLEALKNEIKLVSGFKRRLKKMTSHSYINLQIVLL